MKEPRLRNFVFKNGGLKRYFNHRRKYERWEYVKLWHIIQDLKRKRKTKNKKEVIKTCKKESRDI